MTVSSKTLLARDPPVTTGKGKAGFRGESAWRVMARNNTDLRLALERRKSPFLQDMLKLVSLMSYLRKILQDEAIRKYLMEHHRETLNKIETTLGYLQRQADAAESEAISMWTVAKARKQMEALISRARSQEPQVIGLGRRPLVVVISARTWKSILRRHPEVEALAMPKPLTPRPVQSSPARVRRSVRIA